MAQTEILSRIRPARVAYGVEPLLPSVTSRSDLTSTSPTKFPPTHASPFMTPSSVASVGKLAELPKRQKNFKREGAQVLGAFIDALSWGEALTRLVEWGDNHESRYVCICNVHSVVTGTQDASFMKVLNEADMATTDGTPIAWTLRYRGYPTQKRINGPDLMWRYLAQAEARGQVVFFYGSTEDTLALLKEAMLKAYPRLRIGGMESPPFRQLSEAEDQAYVDQINESGAAVVFVGLGCPKQERWMAEHRGRVNAVMVGVGAAFDYHAGTVRRAPLWMQRSGLEWLHRMASEPRRLGRRYVVTNTLFIIKTIASYIERRLTRLR